MSDDYTHGDNMDYDFAILNALKAKDKKIEELEAERDLWKESHDSVARAAYKKRSKLEAALQSIADNKCCAGCQEAARVAKAALGREE